ncbi:MAG TPA: prepilin-type N-terminal cleavage/methylation domain-containing protein [bacterium]|nr:prepilin-type N-terminal cleavage/methylation domain-containing protein [bacterium]
MQSRSGGFTLIELLIVVAIIGILAAIAVPNYLNARIRSQLARVQGDMKATTDALEMYRLDNNRYIAGYAGASEIWQLTTPVAYLHAVPKDYFQIKKDKRDINPDSTDSSWEYTPSDGFKGQSYMLSSIGPDRCCFIGHADWWDGPKQWVTMGGAKYYRNMIYNSSNGLISWGNIIVWGGDDTPLRY